MKLSFKSRPVRLLAGGLCLLVLLLVGVMLWPQPRASGLAIQFVGFTNAPGQRRSAVFGVTNLSRRTITFVTPEPQVRTGAGWSEIFFAQPLAIKGVGLGRGQGTQVTVADPDGEEAWRMPIIWSYDMSTVEIYARRVKNMLDTAKEGSLAGWNYGWGLTGYTNFSAEVKFGRAEPDGAANGRQPIRAETNGTSGAAKPTAQLSSPPAKAMSKYDIITDYARFECEPGVHIAADCVSSGQADLDEKNVRIVEGKWKSVWPATFAFLKELRKKYNFDTNFAPAGMRAKLMLADTVMSDEARWEVSFSIVKDGYSEWGVVYRGSTIDPDSSQPYF